MSPNNAEIAARDLQAIWELLFYGIQGVSRPKPGANGGHRGGTDAKATTATDGSQAEVNRLCAELLPKQSLLTAAKCTIKIGFTGRTTDFSSHCLTVINTQLRAADDPSVNSSNQGSAPPTNSPAPNKQDLPGDKQVNAISNLLSAMGQTKGNTVMRGPNGPSGPKPTPWKPKQAVKEAQHVKPDEQDGELDAEGKDKEISIDGGDGKVKGGVGLTTKDSGSKEKAKAA
ncbi:hypothetical protein RSOLAG1IB_10851 [Rhizoctonia solani AG-1 IB]|uniref:Uncharacterized protein n=1 Tax=Thanatephorus cucumeris (strain AG1-IB / isolate 7/3/14) TaxID=1108050 RepID=M5BWF3_THACB|nr:hypothetical protein BN14_05625 [Rhizoctonia solani AG-1 IB]CEL63550.1 hypothetical protein RSOLAG1IB_10851 [Rhizoctonia solani AG-1 IB]